MAVVRPVIQTWKGDGNDERWILIRIEHRKQRIFVSLHQKARPSQWIDSKRRVNSKHRQQKRVNAIIDAAVARAMDTKANFEVSGKPFTAETLKRAILLNPADGEFWQHADLWLDRLYRNGQVYYWKKGQSVLNKFAEFKPRPLAWEEFTPQLLQDFDSFLRAKKKNNPTTRHGSFRILRTVTKDAIRNGVIGNASDPFHQFRLPRPKPKRKSVLSEQQILKLETLELPPGSWLATSRDVFMACFLSWGMRYNDIARLKWSDIYDGRLHYVMRKNQKPISVPIPERLQDVLDRYGPPNDGFIFPILKGKRFKKPEDELKELSTMNALINKSLRELGISVGCIKPLNVHAARRSFASSAQRKGVDIAVIQHSLRHDTEQMTRLYLEAISDAELDRHLSVVTKKD